MIVVLAVITGASGLLLAGVNQGTRERRKRQILVHVKKPAIEDVLQGCENDPLQDVKELADKLVPICDRILNYWKNKRAWSKGQYTGRVNGIVSHLCICHGVVIKICRYCI
jgi:Na+-translocating ferredoxin:NAD+ oxidoreductase RnfG subunit